MQEQNEIQSLLKDAVVKSKVEYLKYLLARFHLTLDTSKDDEGNTLLLIATKMGSNEVVKILLDHGANPNI
jgi:ankyrin repeat protein